MNQVTCHSIPTYTHGLDSVSGNGTGLMNSPSEVVFFLVLTAESVFSNLRPVSLKCSPTTESGDLVALECF